MSRRGFLFLLCLFLPVLFFVPLSRARGVLTVNEPATRLSFRNDNPQLLLAVENNVGKPLDAKVRVELLDPNGSIKASGAPPVTITTGSQKVPINLPLSISTMKWGERSRLLWYRIRYLIEPDPASGVAAVGGILSLSQITPEVFELRISGSQYARPGMRYRATVRAQHPLTNRPAPGVRLNGTIEIEDDQTDAKTTVKAKGISNNEGFAYLDFDLPEKIDTDEVDLAIKGVRGSIVADAERSIDLPERPYIFVSSDKALYQPGQVLHARVLMFGPGKRALPNAAVKMVVLDPEDEVQFSADLTTSRFGVASADWTIPSNCKLGQYQVQFSPADDDEHNGSVKVKISRYELPNFAVGLKSDRSYYLPNQNAAVEVSAAYLFGQPVKHGKVRLVRETERTWN